MANNRLAFAGKTDRGNKRPKNEDNYWPKTNNKHPRQSSPHGLLFVVADGMGGHGAGDVAAKIAVDVIPDIYYSEQNHETNVASRLETAIQTAHQTIRERALQDSGTERMGTTVVAVVIQDNCLQATWAGDSRVYRLHKGQLEQITSDHSEVWPLIEANELTWDQFHSHPRRSKLTNSLSARRETVRISHEQICPLGDGDQILLCSDGLTGEVRNREIAETLNKYVPAQAVKLLEQKAKAETIIENEGKREILPGGKDNITSLVIEMPGGPPRLTGLPNRKVWLGVAGIVIIILVLVFASLNFFWTESENSSLSQTIAEDTNNQAREVIGLLGETTPTVPAAISVDNNSPSVLSSSTSTPTLAPGEMARPTSTLAPTSAPRTLPTDTPIPVPQPQTPLPTNTTSSTPLGKITIVAPENNYALPRSMNSLMVKWRWEDERGINCEKLPNGYGFEIRVWRNNPDVDPLGAMDAKKSKNGILCETETGIRLFEIGEIKKAPGIAGADAGEFRVDVALVQLEPYEPAYASDAIILKLPAFSSGSSNDKDDKDDDSETSFD